MSKEKIINKVAIYAIAHNELPNVDEWITSMNEADYIAVLDTGSTDGTYEKLLEYQKKEPDKFFISQKEIKPWRFDIARNESLKLVPEEANILMCTDLDERLHPGWAEILREKWEPGKHTRCSYKYIWSHLPNGEPGRIFGYNKIHTWDWIWKYPVHELLWNTKTHTELNGWDECLNLFDEITLEHFPADKASRSSYLPLLELREEENPDDMYGLIYLAHEYNYRGLYEKSIEKLNKTLTVFDNKLGPVERASCYLFIGDDYVALHKPADAIHAYLRAIEIDPTYREPYINLAKLYLDLKEYDLAVAYVRKGIEKSYRHYTWLERDKSWTYEPFDILSLAYYYGGDKINSLACAVKALSYAKSDERLKHNVDIILELTDDKLY